MIDWLAAHLHIIVALALPVAVPLILFQVLPLMVLIERRGAAYIQDRPGPNRAGINIHPGMLGALTGNKGAFQKIFAWAPVGLRLRAFGMIFNGADFVKLAFKESFLPPFVHKGFYLVGPAIPLIIGLLTPALLPWFAPITYQVAGQAEAVTIFGQSLMAESGLLLFFALGSLSVYGVVLGSWASNSKYPMLGGLRASAMMISYEVSMGLAVLGMLLIVGSFSLTDIVEWQGNHTWGIVVQPVGFLLFLVAMFAECNRNPFDVAEGESEIVGGFHTEYSSMKFMLFMTAEYLHMIVAAALIATLFLGGYHLLPVGGFGTVWVRQHIGPVLGVLLALGGAGMLAFAWLITRRRAAYLRKAHSDNASRNREYTVYAVVFALLGLAHLGAGAAAWLLLPVPTAVIAAGGLAIFPWWASLLTAVVQFSVILVKTILVCGLFVWVRWTLPRFRYDQIMALGWKVLLNIALVNLLVTAVVAKLVK